MHIKASQKNIETIYFKTARAVLIFHETNSESKSEKRFREQAEVLQHVHG